MAGEPVRAGYRSHLIEIALVTVIVGATVFCFCALSITYDIHQARIEQASLMGETKREVLRRVDAMLWKADTALEIAGTFKTELGSVLTKLRAQVKQASDESTKVSRIETHETTKAVAQAIQKSTETAIAVTKGETPDAVTPENKAPITVNVPPPVVVAPSVPIGGDDPEETRPNPETPRKRHWWGWIWLPWRR